MHHGNSEIDEFASVPGCMYLAFQFCFLLFFLSFFICINFFHLVANVPIMNKKAKFEAHINQMLNVAKVRIHLFFKKKLKSYESDVILFVFTDCYCSQS